MFDTVTLLALNIDIDPNHLDGTNSFTFINDEGNYISKYSFSKEGIFYKYNLQKMILEIQLSIPKFIYGTNTKMINESDIEVFWIKLNSLLKEHLNINISKEQWKVKRLDTVYNFKVDNVRDEISKINKQTISKMTKITYNQNETVLFKNKSSSICFYDKEKECINGEDTEEIMRQAKGILRLEIRPSYYHFRKYSSERKAIELITKEFYIYIIECFKINELLKSVYDNSRDISLFGLLNNMKVADIEKAIGFKALIETIGETTLLDKGYYRDGTLRSRKKLISEYNKNMGQYIDKQKQLYILLD